MKTGEDFRREFPEMAAGLETAALEALEHLPEQKQRWYVSRKVAMLATALLMMLATAALATGIMRWGAKEFIEANQFANMTPEAESLLENSVVEVPLDTPVAKLTLRQAVYDGMAVYLLFEAIPAQEGWMVAMGAEYGSEDQAFSHGSCYPKDVSISEYAAQQGYAGVQLLEIFSDEVTGSIFDSAPNEDGSFSLMVWAFVRPEYRGLPEITLNLRVNDATVSRLYETSEPRHPVTLPLAGEVCVSVCTQATAIPEAGIAVTGVAVHRTAMTSYILIDYDVTDKTRYDRAIFTSWKLTLTDADGNVLQKGTHPLSLVVDRPAQGMGEGTYYITNRQFPKDADAIVLQFESSRYIFPLQ